ncbi:hypothetical protein ACFWSF_14590 [Streptomyces sp. NPDC058611]|uniref:hypothetical protein n=1 Tax=unclassified Streptomyces TaxID=2593676 RepID=UPI00365E3E1D
MIEELDELDVLSGTLDDPFTNHLEQNRMSAEIEEVVVVAHLGDVQNFAPDLGDDSRGPYFQWIRMGCVIHSAPPLRIADLAGSVESSAALGKVSNKYDPYQAEQLFMAMGMNRRHSPAEVPDK